MNPQFPKLEPADLGPLGDLTDPQLLALALMLLKSFWQMPVENLQSSRGTKSLAFLTDYNCRVASKVLALAGRVGAGKDFLSVVMEMPVLKAEFKEMEQWDKSSWLYAAASPRTSRRERPPAGKRKPSKPPSKPKKSKYG